MEIQPDIGVTSAVQLGQMHGWPTTDFEHSCDRNPGILTDQVVEHVNFCADIAEGKGNLIVLGMLV